MTTELNVPGVDFRAKLPNADGSGGRQWLYPRAAAGRFTRGRTWLAWALLAALFAGPFVWIDGHPLFLFDVLERRFIVFGIPFWPQDFHLVAIGLVAFIVFVALFTVVFGRVWCGWACPQTIFMEMVFRPIETLIEGDHKAKKRLDALPWTAEKIMKKSAKHLIFFGLAFAISNTFLAYLIGRDRWLTLVTDDPAQHPGGLAAMLTFTAVFYLVFAHVREIVCTTICPYGRLQGVLLDKNSLVVAYDYLRGEPRGKKKREGQTPEGSRPSVGACVDCTLCVQVCPTGIDIRNGTQLECINCTACIDACDAVMDKIGRPRGLIRLASQTGIEQGQPFRLTGRIWAYSAVLLALVAGLAFLLLSRPDVEATILRAPGQLFQREGRYVSNLYTVELMNKTYRPLTVQLRLIQPDARRGFAGRRHAGLRFVQPLTTIPAGELTKGTFFIRLPEKVIRQNSTPLTIEILSGGQVVDRVTTTFLGPG